MEKRGYEWKIPELEEELKKMDSFKADNTLLKEANAALIRVISKLSKWSKENISFLLYLKNTTHAQILWWTNQKNFTRNLS
jgi:hypothetical protein